MQLVSAYFLSSRVKKHIKRNADKECKSHEILMFVPKKILGSDITSQSLIVLIVVDDNHNLQCHSIFGFLIEVNKLHNLYTL